jgi:hypothetical protein
LAARGTDVDGAETRGARLPYSPDLAAPILLLIQNRGHYWVEEGQVVANWSHSIQASAASLVGKLLPLARPQRLMFESDREPRRYTADGPAVFVRYFSDLALSEDEGGCPARIADNLLSEAEAAAVSHFQVLLDNYESRTDRFDHHDILADPYWHRVVERLKRRRPSCGSLRG